MVLRSSESWQPATSGLSYPQRPNVDASIAAISPDAWHLFTFGEQFRYALVDEQPDLMVNQVAIQDKDLVIVTTHLPQETVVLSADDQADVTLTGQAYAQLVYENGEHHYYVQARAGKVYVNGAAVVEQSGAFVPGTQLVLDGLIIERLADQLKWVVVSDVPQIHALSLRQEPFKPAVQKGFPDYQRSPRILMVPPTDKVALQKPEQPAEKKRGEIARMIFPPIGMFAASGVSALVMGRNPLFLLTMVAGSFITTGVTVSAFFKNKKEDGQREATKQADYDAYLLRRGTELEALAQSQRRVADFHFPDSNQLAQWMMTYDSRLYERQRENSDFMAVALGTGSVPSTYEVEFQLDDVPKTEQEKAVNRLATYYQTLDNMPITTSLRTATLGLVGTYPVMRDASQMMLFQLAANQSYRDVQFVALVPEADYEEHWSDWRWLPHFQLSALNLRGLIHDERTRDMVLRSFYQVLNQRRQVLKEAGRDRPNFDVQYVFLILDSDWMQGQGINEFLAEDMSQYGVTVIWGKEQAAMLPETVTTRVDYQNMSAGELITEEGVLQNKQFTPMNAPTSTSVVAAIQRLANLNHIEVEKNAIPTSVDFLDMYGVKNVAELDIAARWAKADTSKSLAVPLGYRGKDDIVDLNLHERAHGPHGLVAGTTGSGKSETVQSYMLSLAINFGPEDVGFLPIDFKGGGMANLFKDLPHLMGAITNLDGAASARALASIRAESQKRQAMFNKYDVNNISKYTRLYQKGKSITDPEEKAKYPTEPIPHLFLISDEFAELKANEPDFMDELVSIARIGRSLGIHLILATQKPSGVVNDQIWSNSKFKLALKVQDKSDSNEILHTPDAASIVEPGRAYLQVGNNEIYELFQSAYSGGPYRPNQEKTTQVDERIYLVNDLGQSQLLETESLADGDDDILAAEDNISELDAVVQEIVKVAEETNAPLPPKPWLPPLGKQLTTPVADFHEAWATDRNFNVPFGVMDLPQKQAQEQMDFDITSFGHTAIYGSAGFGKTNALLTLIMNLARQNTPEQVQFNLLDFGTNGLFPVKNLPHVTDLARIDETEKVTKFIQRIHDDIEGRKAAFAEAGVASVSQYEAKTGRQLPIILTVIDVYDTVRDNKLEGLIETLINQILREGNAVGMYFMTTGLRDSTLKIAMRSNIPTPIAYFLVDDNATRTIMGRDFVLPEEIVGRAQVAIDAPVAFQTFLPARGSDDIERMQNLEAEITAMDATWQGDRPKRIPIVPKELPLDTFMGMAEVKQHLATGRLPVGMDINTTEIMAYDPSTAAYFTAVSQTGTQQESVSDVFVRGLAALNDSGQYKVVVFDSQENFAADDARFTQVIQPTMYEDVLPNLALNLDARIEEGADDTYIWYFPDWPSFAAKAMPSNNWFSKIVANVKQAKVYPVIQAMKTGMGGLDSDPNGASQYIKQNMKAAMVGTKWAEQTYIQGKADFSEIAMASDQMNFVNGRQSTRIKLPGEGA
jgi:S-DNA-T family DNA segregation ATPase FtsK/SpoIIIE